MRTDHDYGIELVRRASGHRNRCRDLRNSSSDGFGPSNGVKRKGTKHRCRAPPEAGLFLYSHPMESVDDGFPEELYELFENKS